MRLYATKVVLKQAATNVSQNHYSSLDFLSLTLKVVLLNVCLNAACFICPQYNVLFY